MGHSFNLCLRASLPWCANESGFADVSSVFPGLTVWSLLARLWPGEGAPSLFPPSQSFGGPEAPPATAGEVAQTFRGHSE
jgi:hypothetical protein